MNMNTGAKVGIGVGVVALVIGVWQIGVRDPGAFGFIHSPKAAKAAPVVTPSSQAASKTSANAHKDNASTSHSPSEPRVVTSVIHDVPGKGSRAQISQSGGTSSTTNPATAAASGGAAAGSGSGASRTPEQQKVYDGLKQIELQRRNIVQQMQQIAGAGPQIPPRPSDDATAAEKQQWAAAAQPIFDQKMNQVRPLINQLEQLAAQTEALVPSAFTRVEQDGPEGPGIITRVDLNKLRAAAGGSLPLEDMGLPPLSVSLEGPNVRSLEGPNVRIYISAGRPEDMIFGPGG